MAIDHDRLYEFAVEDLFGAVVLVHYANRNGGFNDMADHTEVTIREQLLTRTPDQLIDGLFVCARRAAAQI